MQANTQEAAITNAARQAEVARDYLKRAARIDKLNGHPPGSDGPMATALKRFNGGRVLVFVMGAFAEMPEDVSRICDIIARDLARTHVSYYNDDAKRTKGMYRPFPSRHLGTSGSIFIPCSARTFPPTFTIYRSELIISSAQIAVIRPQPVLFDGLLFTTQDGSILLRLR